MSESSSVPLILFAYFKNYLCSFSFLKLFSSNLVSSYRAVYVQHSVLWNLWEYMLYVKLNTYITICRIKALLSIVKKKEHKLKVKSYTSSISKANLKSFMKCDKLAILLQGEMPNLSLSWIFDNFKKCYITLHAVAEYKWSFIGTRTTLKITSFSIKSLVASLYIPVE